MNNNNDSDEDLFATERPRASRPARDSRNPRVPDSDYSSYHQPRRSSGHNDKPNNKNIYRKKTKRSRIVGYLLTLIQLILSIIVTGLLIYINVLPSLYLVAAIAVLLIFAFLVFVTQLSKRMRLPGKFLSILIIAFLCFATYYLLGASGAFEAITGADSVTNKLSVIVLKDDSAKSLSDVTDYNFGRTKVLDSLNVEKSISNIKKLTGTTITIKKEYDEYATLASALLKGKVKAIIFNEANRSSVEEKYPAFATKTRVITTFAFTSKIAAANKVEPGDPFIAYLSGNDQTGDIADTGRTDVNICAVVNPKTKSVLLLSTPRDAYVELVDKSGNVPAGCLDKLTHSGNYGIDVSMTTLGAVYDCTLNYYIKVNFTGFADIVDALGGIEIDSPYDFTAVDGDHYTKGINQLDGRLALNYARERHAFADGDLQRNKNQTQVLTAIIKKMISPDILNNYSDLMNGVKKSFVTSLQSSEISQLVRMQLSDGSNWDITSFNVGGIPSTDFCYSLGSSNSTVILNDADVASAKNLIDEYLAGKSYTQDFLNQMKAKNANSPCTKPVAGDGY